MVGSNGFRGWLSSNLAPLVFLIAYFFTVVLGNLLYLLPSFRSYLEMAMYTSKILTFGTLFSGGYWLLLLSPFVVTPATVWLVRRVASKPLEKMVSFFPEFTRTSYVVLLVVCYALVSYALWHADAFKLFLAGGDFSSSIEARFQIRDRVGFFNTVILMSNLHFLSIFAAVKWTREGGYWWGVATITNIVLISLLLISLNMKWPIIIFYAGLIMALFVYTRRRPFIKTIIGMVVLLLVYFMISAFVYRLSPEDAQADQSVVGINDQAAVVVPEQKPLEVPEAPKLPEVVKEPPAKVSPPSIAKVVKDKHAAPEVSVAKPSEPVVPREEPPVVQPEPVVPEPVVVPTPAPVAVEHPGKAEELLMLSAAIGERVPMMMFHAVNRMASIYPYYYEVFTTRGQVCGGLVEQARIGQKCRPSYFIYSEMFDDQFNGRGTAPAAVHITAYALGGWSLAAVGLICASIVLGLFAALPLTANAIVGALAITGGVVGYHFSQLPGEGPIFYDHGVFWTILMLLGYALFVKLQKALLKK